MGDGEKDNGLGGLEGWVAAGLLVLLVFGVFMLGQKLGGARAQAQLELQTRDMQATELKLRSCDVQLKECQGRLEDAAWLVTQAERGLGIARQICR